MRYQLHELELVYPPVSNQEAEWIKNDPEVFEEVSKSNLYFIGQRPETFFLFEDDVENRFFNEKRIYFTYKTGKKYSKGYIDIDVLVNYMDYSDDIDIVVELGSKLIRIWDQAKGEVIEWFTTEKILHDKCRQKPYIKEFNDYSEFYIYNLHYVGISKKEDSFSRLIVRPHDKRLRILSNEHPLNSGSRLTDEIVLFFFRIKSTEIKQYMNNSDFDQFGKNELGDYTRIVADAEKAFVKIMNTEYNEVKFKDYPLSTDGLYNTTVDKHTYSIDEDIKFITPTNIIRGVRRNVIPIDHGDFIAISKEIVELIKLDDYDA